MKIRPTSDVVREAVFDIVGQDLSGYKSLDLFAGTGSLGLEALSRGSHPVYFVDNSLQSIRLIKKNLILCGHESSGIILRRDLKKGIRRSHPLAREVFDLAFLDPPYAAGYLSGLLEALSTQGFLSSGALVVAESAKRENLPVAVGRLQMRDTRSYGDTRISIYAFEVKT
jgi:16S rRNA (guanine966-N2)-methyltransferase